MTQAKIHVLPFTKLAQVLRGEAELVLPKDAQVVGASVIDAANLGLRIHSVQYPWVREGNNPPVAAATIRTKAAG
jgi:hypothetical protein